MDNLRRRDLVDLMNTAFKGKKFNRYRTDSKSGEKTVLIMGGEA